MHLDPVDGDDPEVLIAQELIDVEPPIQLTVAGDIEPVVLARDQPKLVVRQDWPVRAGRDLERQVERWTGGEVPPDLRPRLSVTQQHAAHGDPNM